MNRWLPAAWVLVMVAAMVLRAPRLDLRPMHNDEAVNAMKFRQLWVNKNYKYDPNEFHGPALPYATLPAAWIDGADFNGLSEATFRGVTVVFGMGLIVVLLWLRRDFGQAETWWAGALTAISPAMVFYSRDYIHEMLLVFFTALSFVACWRYLRSGRLAWAVTAGTGMGLMAATKETFVLALAAMALAAGSAVLWGRWRGAARAEMKWKWRDIGLGLGVALAVAMVFFSSFFTNAAGVPDAVRTYLPWLHRAGGATVHEHPWDFYFRRLFFFRANGGPVWSEGLIGVLAAAGFLGALFGRGAAGSHPLPARLAAFYTLWLTAIYTALSYKTPWCLLGFYDGMILLAGVGAAMLLRSCRSSWLKATAGILLAAGVLHLAWQAWRGNFEADRAGVLYCASPKNPYVYSQTSPDVLQLVQTVEGLARVSPQADNTIIDVMSPESYWPLPWYLRRFKNAGFSDQIPEIRRQTLAPITIVATDLHAAFDQRPGKTHLMAGYFELRPGVFLELYVQTNLWGAYVKTLPPEE